MSDQLALPQDINVQSWTAEQKALVKAAGLVYFDKSQQREVLADQSVVANFLHQCQRTGLDPLSRQIYCIPRQGRGGTSWTIQVSIDGARLIAERSGEYEGQTTPEFTGDGVTWTQVWLADTPPAAARVGVYRKSFREPLYAVAQWDAYVQLRDEYADGRRTGRRVPTEMWQKMGPLMLAKCAEALALRKAFPNDLSGLYTGEEMGQAGNGKPAQAQAQAQQPAQQPVEQPAEDVVEAELVQFESAAWVARVEAASSVDELRELWHEAKLAGVLAEVIAEREGVTLDGLIRAQKGVLEGGEQ